jgi:HlyD family secretion protein
VRRNIKLGRENPSYYEVRRIETGEKVITSSYADYKEVEELNIQ